MKKNSESFKNIKHLPFKGQNVQLYCADEDECCDGHGVDVTSVVRGSPGRFTLLAPGGRAGGAKVTGQGEKSSCVLLVVPEFKEVCRNWMRGGHLESDFLISYRKQELVEMGDSMVPG